MNIQNLPTLTGTEKQISWATSIRAKAITNALERTRVTYDADVEGMGKYEMFVRYALRNNKDLKTARWWIDSRDTADWKLMTIVRNLVARAEKTFFCPDCETFDDRCASGCIS